MTRDEMLETAKELREYAHTVARPDETFYIGSTDHNRVLKLETLAKSLEDFVKWLDNYHLLNVL